jgi:oxygen-independent coproporphyrinogen-3 oxidase
MSKTAILELDGNKYEFPVIVGSENEVAIDIEKLLALAPEHISAYSLTVEEKTVFGKWHALKKFTPAPDEENAYQFELIMDTLSKAGYEHYEISNFAREGYVCRHNIGCWTRVPYLGFGCAAHSFFDECRTMNPATLDAYLSGEEPQTEQISKEEARFESLMLGLRMTRGVKDEDFTYMHELSIREAFGEKLDKPIAAGLLEWHEGALRLTRVGMDLQNSVLVDLL